MTINYIFEKQDSYTAPNQNYLINFFDSKTFAFTFWNNFHKMKSWYNEKSLDLLYISLAVFAADRLIRRDDGYDNWSRNITIYIPVLNLNVWNNNKKLLEDMLDFLSGDNWKFKFRKRELTLNENSHKEKMEKSKKKIEDYDQICMFSGGLDSFIGAIDLLENGKKNTMFVSHYGGGKGTKEYQDVLKEKIIGKYDLEVNNFNQFFAKVVNGVEDTTRTRSFMFFSHAIALATMLNKKIDIIIPENGFISLNIPSTISRIGTSSTRTTHPYYLKLLQQLLDNLQLEIKLKNPYQFYTKGEMIKNCKNIRFLEENISNTMSCSHPDSGRMQGEKTTKHCGYCLPCVIRQASIKKAGIKDNSLYRDSKFNIFDIAKMNYNSYRLGLEKFNPKYAFMSIQKSGQISDNIEKYSDIYIRGMNEMKEYINSLK